MANSKTGEMKVPHTSAFDPNLLELAPSGIRAHEVIHPVENLDQAGGEVAPLEVFHLPYLFWQVYRAEFGHFRPSVAIKDAK